jgi:hypothetical protein
MTMSSDDFFDGFDWPDFVGIAGAMSEEERDRIRIEHEIEIPDPLDEVEDEPEDPDYEDFIP